MRKDTVFAKRLKCVGLLVLAFHSFTFATWI